MLFVTDGAPKDLRWGAPLGAVALMRPLEVVKLQEAVERYLQLMTPPEVTTSERHPPVFMYDRSPNSFHESVSAWMEGPSAPYSEKRFFQR